MKLRIQLYLNSKQPYNLQTYFAYLKQKRIFSFLYTALTSMQAFRSAKSNFKYLLMNITVVCRYKYLQDRLFTERNS